MSVQGTIGIQISDDEVKNEWMFQEFATIEDGNIHFLCENIKKIP